ncbi:MAG: Rpn family recombination-promoting nuclease/putative transposase, partial [Roseburia sp.]|nr:Rpn family recombination-promoting nuclease/putative transposase [Roseburia sp.]
MEKQTTAVSIPMPASDFPDSATGPIAIRMTNDYLFRALLQRSNKALKGLISSLLHMKPEQIQSAVITNPIELGESIDEKTFILDVKVILNNNAIINLE